MERQIDQLNKRKRDKKVLSNYLSPTDLQKIFLNYFYTTQLITNGKFNEYFKRFKLRTDGWCDCDGVTPQTAEHLIFECQLLDSKREEMRQKVIETYGSFPCGHHQLIDQPLIKYFNEFCINIFN